MFRTRRLKVADFQIVGILNVLAGGLAAFLDNRLLGEALAKDQLGELDHRGGAVFSPQRGRGAYGAQMPFGSLESCLHPADQAGEVCALRPVECVDLVNHQIAQRIRAIFLPKAAVVLPDQQVVQHLIVGHQDVRWGFPHLLPAGDDTRLCHLLRRFALTTDIKPDSHLANACGIFVHHFRETPGLVPGQGVHRIENDRLDTALCRIRQYMVEDRIDETLRFT